MTETIIYKQDLDGNTVRLKGRTHRASRELEDFDTRMIRTLHRMECDEGARFSVPGYSKNQLRKVWGRL
jgi:hypothetical protein